MSAPIQVCNSSNYNKCNSGALGAYRAATADPSAVKSAFLFDKRPVWTTVRNALSPAPSITPGGRLRRPVVHRQAATLPFAIPPGTGAVPRIEERTRGSLICIWALRLSPSLVSTRPSFFDNIPDFQNGLVVLWLEGEDSALFTESNMQPSGLCENPGGERAEENERDGVRFISAGRENEKNSVTRYRPKSAADCEAPVTRNEHQTEDRCADLLKDILVERKGTGWVFHIREPAAALSDINITESFCTETIGEHWEMADGTRQHYQRAHSN
ncbi:hypothetical protein EYF80_025181 [Liparis tanakae]|uniref:Uncharacterized protein n=1 Tax=Liparis tanakae TaxID=230148 RepID=A0A4Z2HI19_9TELE|nr:hypothetical protein EYF80_025181 [Liparis tanakae]